MRRRGAVAGLKRRPGAAVGAYPAKENLPVWPYGKDGTRGAR
jgi:hypothetical protein